jgi:hypothetical protein
MGLFGTPESRQAARAARRAARAARQAQRQASRTDRAYGRQTVRSNAYAAGFDPNKGWSSVASDVVDAAGKFAMRNPAPRPAAPGGAGVPALAGVSPLLIVGVLFLMMKK